MSRKGESVIEVFLAAAILVTVDWFIVMPNNALSQIGSLAVGLLFAVIAVALICRAVEGFVKNEKSV